MKGIAATFSSSDVAEVQLSMVRELIFKASSSVDRDVKVKSLLLASEHIRKSLEFLGIDVENGVDVKIKK